MLIALAVSNIIFAAVIIFILLRLRSKIARAGAELLEPLCERTETLRRALEQRFADATADMAQRVERTKGELRQETTDRLNIGFGEVRECIEKQLSSGRDEQSRTMNSTVGRLENKFSELQWATEEKLELFATRQAASQGQARQELGMSLGQTAEMLKKELMDLTSQTRDSLLGTRSELGQTLSTSAETLKREVSLLSSQTSARLDGIRASTEHQLEAFSDRQSLSLAQARKELGESLERNSSTVKQELTTLIGQTAQSLDGIRCEVDRKLSTISDQVTVKLDQNMKEGFKQFEKVQEHLRAAEEQLKNVSVVGSSINDLNNLLKLPHLRGRFGEASLERLLADFLPAHMYELQASAGPDGSGRADAIIKFPERALPIDAKFPREQVLPLFESSDPAELAAARGQFARVMKEQGKRVAGYIHPENGSTDMALMYLPSETLYMETVLNGELSEWLNKLRVFPVSPNTLIVTLQAIQMVFKMYEFAKSYERATEELRKAQAAFGYFEKQFDRIGTSLVSAQEAYEVARGHLNRYRNRVTNLAGDEQSHVLENGTGENPEA